MTPRAEVVTMTKQGLAGFLRELKRTTYRHQVPMETALAKIAKTPKLQRALKKKWGAAWQQSAYAAYIDKCVSSWEEDQADVVKRAADKARAERVKAAERDSDDLSSSLSTGLLAGFDNSRALAAAFASVKFYIGDLNRDLNEARVAAYRTAMEKGEWWFSPDPVVVTDEGNIINGQHRLLAVEAILSGGSVKDSFGGMRYYRKLEQPWGDANAPQFVVVWGVDKRAAILMDEARRSSTDRRDIAIRYARAAKS